VLRGQNCFFKLLQIADEMKRRALLKVFIFEISIIVNLNRVAVDKIALLTRTILVGLFFSEMAWGEIFR
jgi:hypothetical protein